MIWEWEKNAFYNEKNKKARQLLYSYELFHCPLKNSPNLMSWKESLCYVIDFNAILPGIHISKEAA